MFSKSKRPLDRASVDEATPNPTTRPLTNGSPLTNGKVVAQPVASARRRGASAHDPAAAERDERRHRRAIVRERSAGERGGKTGDARKRDDARAGDAQKRGTKAGERLHQAKDQLAEPSRRGRLALGETVSLGLIGIVGVGVAVGAILGAVGAAGWIVGLLVATLTLVLSAAFRRTARRSRPALR